VAINATGSAASAGTSRIWFCPLVRIQRPDCSFTTKPFTGRRTPSSSKLSPHCPGRRSIHASMRPHSSVAAATLPSYPSGIRSDGSAIGRSSTSRPNSATSQSIDDRIQRRLPPGNRSRGAFKWDLSC